MSTKTRWATVGVIFEDKDRSHPGDLKLSGHVSLGLLGEIPIIVRKSQFSKHPRMYQLLTDVSNLPLQLLQQSQQQQEKEQEEEQEDPPPTTRRFVQRLRNMRPPEGHEGHDEDDDDCPF